MALLFAVQVVASFFIGVDGYRPRSLVVKSTFIKNKSYQVTGYSNHDVLSRSHCKSSALTKESQCHNECNSISIRGGAYEDYNDGYGYNDDRGYNDDYRYNDYGQDKAYGGQNDRYEDDYYPERRGDGYYDDEGRYYEDGRGAGRSVSFTLVLIIVHFLMSRVLTNLLC